MRIAAYERYGPPEVVQIRQAPVPTPQAGELLIRVTASTVNSADARLRSLRLPPGFGVLGRLAFGIQRPRQPVLGSELAGVVVRTGPGASAFRRGDRVFAFTGGQLGCHAEFRCLPAQGGVALIPRGLSDAQAAALCFGGATMLDFFGRAGLRAGEQVLVNGAAGTVGSAAVQLARHFGARVTAVCSRANAEWISRLGAERTIDYAVEDFAGTSAFRYDVIVDTVGNAPMTRCARVLAPGGRLLLINTSLSHMLRAPWDQWRSGRRVLAGPAAERPQYVHQLRELAQARRFMPVIDCEYSFDDIQAAHARVDGGHKRGSVVLRLPEGP